MFSVAWNVISCGETASERNRQHFHNFTGEFNPMDMQSFLASGICIALLSYLIGSIPFGYLIGRFNGLDIRRHGSRNIGATNVRRVLGRDWGVVCFILDFLKGLLPVILFGQFLGAQTAVGVGWGEMFAVAGTIGGHIFPFTLNFKGGKGVATSLGAILAVAFWPVLIGAVVWYITFLKTRIVSLASIMAAISLPVAATFMLALGMGGIHGTNIILMAIIAALIIVRHKDNIIRLRNGQENKFSKQSAKS
jgi:glycerol-3-phosphate acyltransferase PlsY